MLHSLPKLVVRGGVLLLAAVLLCDVGHVFNIQPPAAPSISQLATCDQQWSDEKARWFHTASQGTMIMPAAWFIALEQPEVRVLTIPRLLHEEDYLKRFGFIYDELRSKTGDDAKRNTGDEAKRGIAAKSNKAKSNADDKGDCPELPKLPIGFAVEDKFRDPHDDQAKAECVVGLTCAACHTGQINYQGTGIRIEGAPGNVDLGLFQSAVGRSLAFTLYVPWRFDRFAHRVLGEKYDDASQSELKARFRKFVESKLHAQLYADSQHLYDLKGGNGRTDALALIGNRAFQNLGNPENLAVTNAPVNFPPLWDAPWFDWVQYNASIAPPMVRNIGEALGVGAQVVIDAKDNVRQYKSSVNVENLHKIESSLAGPAPFKGLASPAWPEKIFGPLAKDKIAAGKQLYEVHCIICHPLISELKESYTKEGDQPGWTNAYGTSGDLDYLGSRLIELPPINLRRIGTDPAQALNMHKRVVQSADETLSEGLALMRVTEGVREKKYKELNLTPEQRREYDSYRQIHEGRPEPERAPYIIADNLAYRPRPLNGAWATAPYLHNGSVPNLYELLLPVERRSKKFHAGSREFDPHHVGFLADANHGVFLFDTTIAGNFNKGHEFRNLTLEEFEGSGVQLEPADSQASTSDRWAKVLGLAPRQYQELNADDRQEHIRRTSAKFLRDPENGRKCPPGVLGAELTGTERWNLIEYLKSLDGATKDP